MRYWDGVSHQEELAIQALRRIEPVGHEREDWRAAITTAFIACSFGGKVEPDDVLRAIQLRSDEDERVSPAQAGAMFRQQLELTSGDVR